MNFSALIFVIMLLLSGGIGLPVGVPPAPEDPMMARVIPDDVLMVASWAGVAALEPDADPTQKWMAQQEIQVFSAKLIDAWKSHSGRKKRDADGQQATAVKQLLMKVTETSIGNATTVYVSDFGINGQPEMFRAAAIVALGDKKQAVADLLDAFPTPEDPTDSSHYSWPEKNGVRRLRYLNPRSELVTEVGIWKNYFVIGIGEGEFDQVIANAETAPPAWYTEHREQLPVEKFCSMSYLSLIHI